MNKSGTLIRWSLSGIIFAVVTFYLINALIQSQYDNVSDAYDQSETYKTSTALFISGAVQLFIGFLLMKPRSKTYHVPQGHKEYRDPFVGLDREELADHGYGAEDMGEKNKRKLQGFVFALPGLVLIGISSYIWS